MKKTFILLLALVMLTTVLLAAGCSLEEKPAATDTVEPGAGLPAEGLDLAAVVASVGDEQITMAEYKQTFDMYAEYYASMGYDLTSDEEMLTSFQDFIIDMMISETAVKYQAKVQGFTELNAEQQAELDTLCEGSINELNTYYDDMLAEELAADPTIDVEARKAELVAEESKYYTGTSMTYDEYIQWLKESTTDSYYYELLQQDVFSGVTVDDDYVETWYNDTLAANKEAYTANPGTYKDDQDSFEMYGGDPVLYAPEGFGRILHIQLAPEGELGEDYTEKTARMADIQFEYGDLAFKDAVSGVGDNKAQMAELLAEYNTLKAEAEALEDANLQGAKVKAEEAYAKLAESDFAAVMSEYTEDINFTSFDILKEKGMLISGVNSSEADWSDEIKAEFAKLKPGEYSGVFKDAAGYHIIYYVGDETAGERPLADVKEAIRTSVLEDLQMEEWNALLDEWKNDESVVIDDSLVRSLTVS